MPHPKQSKSVAEVAAEVVACALAKGKVTVRGLAAALSISLGRAAAHLADPTLRQRVAEMDAGAASLFDLRLESAEKKVAQQRARKKAPQVELSVRYLRKA